MSTPGMNGPGMNGPGTGGEAEDLGTPRRFAWMNLEGPEDLMAFRGAMLRRLANAGVPEETTLIGAADADGSLELMDDWGARQVERGCSLTARLIPRHLCEGDEYLDELNPVESGTDLEMVIEAAWENREGYGLLELSISGDEPERMRLAADDLLELARRVLEAGDPTTSPEISVQNGIEPDGEGLLRYTDRNELRLHLRRPGMPGLIEVMIRDEDAMHIELMEEAAGGGNAAPRIPEMEIGLGPAYGEMNRN